MQHGAPVVAPPVVGAVEHTADPHGEGPLLLGWGAESWVYASITIFILLAVFWARAHRRIASALDERIEAARKQLEEAAQLRREAEALLARARAQEAASAESAQAILAQAEEEAKALVADADREAVNLVERRRRIAEERIAAAERQAVADLRATVATAATQAAGLLIKSNLDAKADQPIVQDAIRQLN